MPIYSFKCPVCDLRGEKMRSVEDRDVPIYCPQCGGRDATDPRIPHPMKRIPTMFTAKPSMPEHFNATIGTFVHSKTQFEDELKRMSEERTIRTGIEHNFVSHDPREMKDELGVTDEGLEETYRRRHDEGDTATTSRMKREGVWL